MSDAQGFVWAVDPVFLRLGPLRFRYYGLFMLATVLMGFFFVRRHLLRKGYSSRLAEQYMLLIVLAFPIGARVAHCIFYDPLVFVTDPLEVLRIWEGGLASHGAAIGIALVTVWLAWWQRVPLLTLADAGVFTGAVAATLVRVGNFFNSEILGRATTMPWAVRFVWRDGAPRHPSQLYEALGGLLILIMLVRLDAKWDRRPGVLCGTFLIVYFSFRFCIEFVKEYQVLRVGLTMGQLLSLPCIGIGCLVLVWGRWRERVT